jgi:hypothetical protein
LSGRGGENYQSVANFDSFGINLEYLEYPEFQYPRSSILDERSDGSEIQQPLSVLDFLFTYGTDFPERFSSYLGHVR